MAPEYRGEQYYQSLVGKCYKLRLDGYDCPVYKVISFDGETFHTEHCYLSYGCSVVENTDLGYGFLETGNYEEITDAEYNVIRCHAKHGRIINDLDATKSIQN